jgi:nucleoid DNA-binding protein
LNNNKKDPLYRDKNDKSYDICKYISQRYNFDYNVIKDIHKSIHHYITNELKNGNSIDIKNFGLFEVYLKKHPSVKNLKHVRFVIDENVETFFNNSINFSEINNKYESIDDINPDELLNKLKGICEYEEED